MTDEEPEAWSMPIGDDTEGDAGDPVEVADALPEDAPETVADLIDEAGRLARAEQDADAAWGDAETAPPVASDETDEPADEEIDTAWQDSTVDAATDATASVWDVPESGDVGGGSVWDLEAPSSSVPAASRDRAAPAGASSPATEMSEAAWDDDDEDDEPATFTVTLDTPAPVEEAEEGADDEDAVFRAEVDDDAMSTLDALLEEAAASAPPAEREPEPEPEPEPAVEMAAPTMRPVESGMLTAEEIADGENSPTLAPRLSEDEETFDEVWVFNVEDDGQDQPEQDNRPLSERMRPRPDTGWEDRHEPVEGFGEAAGRRRLTATTATGTTAPVEDGNLDDLLAAPLGGDAAADRIAAPVGAPPPEAAELFGELADGTPHPLEPQVPLDPGTASHDAPTEDAHGDGEGPEVADEDAPVEASEQPTPTSEVVTPGSVSFSASGVKKQKKGRRRR